MIFNTSYLLLALSTLLMVASASEAISMCTTDESECRKVCGLRCHQLYGKWCCP
ncbi:hypothetical protein Vi05172_g9759 [Venturia inaequalis]|nr:hypothetical protein Vi05172_g9759 [Venturia inaequalis]